MSPFRPHFPLTTPVLLLAFNRFETAEQVFERIRQARPSRFYFACDGPRNEEEAARCAKVRALVERVDWPCEVKTRFLDANLGLKYGVSSAITWYFSQEPEGIVLEDDTCPNPSFFWFAQELLERYRTDARIWWILGNNLMGGEQTPGKPSYYFSEHGYGAPWGWAGWKRCWDRYDVEMTRWPEVRDSGSMAGFSLSRTELREACFLFENTHNGNIHTWDYQHDFSRIVNGGLTIIPEINLVRNIGFDGDGTNTVSDNDPRMVEHSGEIQFPLVHPSIMMVDAQRDHEYFKRFIDPGTFRRAKGMVKRMLPRTVADAVRPLMSKMQRGLGLP